MEKKELLKNEQIERLLFPHPLSFMKLQALCIFVIIWGVVVGWIANFSQYHSFFTNQPWIVILVWGIILLLVGVIASLIAVQWSIFFLYLAVFAGGVGLMLWQHWLNSVTLFIPFYSVACSIVGFLMVEFYRRSHKYILTNLRVIFRGGILTKRERTIRYEKISDIDSKQGILGQIFGFGTIIPISQSGFGLGSDKTMAASGVELGSKRAKVIGLVGSGKEVQTPNARTYYELHGAYPFKEVKKLVEDLVQGGAITPYQQEQVEFQKQQVDIQKQMRDLLQKQVREKPKAKATKHTEEEEEEEPQEEEEVNSQEAFPQEQVDIQKQMRDLLKKQRVVKATEPEDETEEEEEEQENQEDKKEIT